MVVYSYRQELIQGVVLLGARLLEVLPTKAFMSSPCLGYSIVVLDGLCPFHLTLGLSRVMLRDGVCEGRHPTKGQLGESDVLFSWVRRAWDDMPLTEHELLLDPDGGAQLLGVLLPGDAGLAPLT